MEFQDDTADASTEWSIGRLARASGLPVKTVRFYSDAGLLPATRARSGHRRYTAADLARLQLIRSLRALDVDLPTIAGLLTDTANLHQVLARHAQILQARLEAVQRQLAVARAAADAPTERTLARLQTLVRLEAAERDQLLQRFWNQALNQTPETDAAWFRTAGTPSLPAAATGEQIDAWLELAAMAADPDFQRVVQAPAQWFIHHARPDLDTTTYQEDMHRALELARQARYRGVDPDDPDDPAVQQVVDAYLSAHAHAFAQEPARAFARWLHQQLTDLNDPRLERWWHLVALTQPPATAPGRDPATVAWIHQALEAAVRS